MVNGRTTEPPVVYEIRVRGILDPQWSDWFDGLVVTPQSGDETLLVGPVADQPALHGILTKISNLGLPLLSVICLENQEKGTK